MAAKEVRFSDDARQKMFAGVNTLANAVVDHPAFERRIGNDRSTEFAEACRQVERIAELRLRALLP